MTAVNKKEEKNKNLDVWESLSYTDPKYTKTFKRSGGFEGTAQNPTYAIKKMTEKFGSCGKGWGFNKPEFTIRDAGEAGVLVYSLVCLWYIEDGQRYETWGVGGDTVVTKTKYGLNADDEAFKKATTDALTNAMKTIGMGADLHLGMYDDLKYVDRLKEQFAEKPQYECTVEEIIANLEKAETVEAIDSTWKLHLKDMGIHKKNDETAYTRITDAAKKHKKMLLDKIKSEADEIMKEKKADNYMDNKINDSIPF